MAPFHDVQLTLEAADIIRIPSADGNIALEVSPSFITAGLVQGWRDRGAHTWEPLAAATACGPAASDEDVRDKILAVLEWAQHLVTGRSATAIRCSSRPRTTPLSS